MMTVFAGHGPAGEVAQGRAVADAAAAAAVPHVVYSSVGGADRSSGVPHFESKWAVERYLHDRGLRTTVVRPVFFMDNFPHAMPPVQEGGTMVLRSPLAPGVPLQMIAVRDIGVIAAAALTAPDLVPAGAVEIAGDELTPEQIAQAFGNQAGTAARYEAIPTGTTGDDDTRAMYTWLSRIPAYQADFALTTKLQRGRCSRRAKSPAKDP